MNNKLVRGTLAGVAAIALAAGGSTFAAWSDFDSLEGSNVGADQLTLVLGEPNSQSFDNLKLAPGEGNDFEFVVASRKGETVTNASLSMALSKLIGTEDGCTSTSSEAAAPTDDCENDGTGPGMGEFVDEAVMSVNISKPTTDVANACNSGAHPRGGVVRSMPLSALADQTAANKLALGTLGKGEGVCVAMGISLPASATNASQGDSAAFDLDFLLEQVI